MYLFHVGQECCCCWPSTAEKKRKKQPKEKEINGTNDDSDFIDSLRFWLPVRFQIFLFVFSFPIRFFLCSSCPANFDSYWLYLFLSFKQLLKHHVVAGSVPSSALQNNGVLQSLLGTPLRVKFYESEDSEWRPLKVNMFSRLFYGIRKKRKNIYGMLSGDRTTRPVPSSRRPCPKRNTRREGAYKNFKKNFLLAKW